MNAFKETLDSWQPFFTAQLGAAATLGGLLFVGLSLNLTKILTYPALPTRALMALILLLIILVVSSLILIPGQTASAIAVEILAVGVIGWASVTVMGLYIFRYAKLHRAGYFGNMVILQLAALPYVVGGALLLGGNSSGLYVVSLGVIVSFVKAMLDAWVLLVEINR